MKNVVKWINLSCFNSIRANPKYAAMQSDIKNTGIFVSTFVVFFLPNRLLYIPVRTEKRIATMIRIEVGASFFLLFTVFHSGEKKGLL